jgi:hypothetical protein
MSDDDNGYSRGSRGSGRIATNKGVSLVKEPPILAADMKTTIGDILAMVRNAMTMVA